MSKKKGGAKKSGGGAEEEDLSTEELSKVYRKHCNKHGLAPLKQIEEKFAEVFEEGTDLDKV